MRPLVASLLGLLLLAGCQTPPPSAFVTGNGAGNQSVPIGNNTVGESCLQLQRGSSADIFCGAWEQPSARVQSGGPAAGRTPASLATSSAWRREVDGRFACGDGTTTTILGSEPVAVLQCTRRSGGWPHVAMVALVGGTIWYADGVPAAVPVMQRSIGVLSGLAKPDTQAAPSGLDALIADRAAARAFSSNDIRDYDDLMAQAKRANLADNPELAERAYRAALAVQEKALGRDAPESTTPLMSLALQLSDQGKFADAEGYFARAAALAPVSKDATALPRLTHYRALHALNQGHPAEALPLLDQAERGYAQLLPGGEAAPARAAGPRPADTLAGGLVNDNMLFRLFATDAMRKAKLGILEVRRYRAIALRELGEVAQSEAATRSAEAYAASEQLTQAAYLARLHRTAGISDKAGNRIGAAESQLAEATQGFISLQPRTRPIVDTELERAALLMRQDRPQQTLAVCQPATRLLRDLGNGAEATALRPCLEAYAVAAEHASGDQQAILAEMFIVAQLARSGATSQQIEEAATRLSENARDPRVGEAIRRREETQRKLNDLIRARDALAQDEAGRPAAAPAGTQGQPIDTNLLRAPGTAPGDKADSARVASLNEQIQAAEAADADADSVLQAASPNFGQLVQQVVTAPEVFEALHPGEALVLITLTDTGGFTFLLRDKTIVVAPIEGGLLRIATLVRRVRVGVERRSDNLPRFDFAAAHQLYLATLGGVEQGLQGVTSLTVVPTGPLLSIPFGTLLTGPGTASDYAGAPWLVRRFTISHVPAVTNFVKLRAIAGGSRASRPWIGFGDFRPVTLAQADRTFTGPECASSARRFAELPRLEGTRIELEAARAVFGAQRSDELLGPAFTAAAVRKLPLKDYRILHFATHALLPAELTCQTQPAIVASAPDGAKDASDALLDAHTVANMDLDAEAVILSACNTGGAGSGAAESLSGLARSFFFAGTRSLLVTHWAADDQAASALVAATLRNLNAAPGEGIAGALAKAQLAWLDDTGSDPELRHPTFWAPFAVIGAGGGAAPSAQRVAASRGKASP